MFKRVERKRKRREEEEELGLDEDTKEIMGLNDTDSDESDSGSEHESAQSDDSNADGISEDRDQEEDAASEDERADENPPISVAEALREPIYLISLDPTVHGCVLCKGKLIKNAGMATAHKNANAHKRRFEHFIVLSADADPRSNAWELVRSIRSASNVRRAEPQALSKRALKRQVKQAAMREKRKRHKKLRAKAITKKALKKLPTADETKLGVPSNVNLQSSPVSQIQSGKTRKKQKLKSKTSTSTDMEARDVTAKSASHTKTSDGSEKPVLKSRLKSTRKGNKLS